MTARSSPPLIRHAEDWRAITSLNVYRSLIAFGLMGFLLLGHIDQLFAVVLPDTFRITALLYLAQCAVALVASLLRAPALRVQIVVACSVDVAFFSLLAFASSGVGGGLGMLLIVPIASAGMLLPGRLAAAIAAVATIAVIGQEILREFQFVAFDGRFVQAGILGSLFFITAGLAQWLANRVRVSEAIAAEAASEVRDLATLNRHIIQRMEAGAVVVDGHDRIELINDAALALLELGERAPEPGKDLGELSPALARALAGWRAHSATAGRDTVSVGSHELLPVFSRLGADHSASALIFLEDVERQSEQAQQLKLVSIGRLSASIAHEIRNPLAAISYARDLLAESGRLDGEDDRLLDIIHRHSQRIDSIVNSVLGLSRPSRLARGVIALDDWLDETLADYAEFRSREPTFDRSDLPSGVCIEFDPEHLRQILFNLCDNAVRYGADAPGGLTIRLAGHFSRRDRFCLDVIDSGPGVDPAILDQIMEPFFTTDREGTGLGLHVAAELCAANGARLSAVAQEHGACFRLLFAQAWFAAEKAPAVADNRGADTASERA